jgi:hypothetical protein
VGQVGDGLHHLFVAQPAVALQHPAAQQRAAGRTQGALELTERCGGGERWQVIARQAIRCDERVEYGSLRWRHCVTSQAFEQRRGAAREAGNTVERARSAITWRIRSAISKLEKVSPGMGKHLSNSIKTGTFCAYSPEQTIAWNRS